MVRRCWVNFQSRGVLLIWIIVGQGPIALAVGAGGGCLDIFSLIYHFSFLSPSLWETARYRLEYCLKGPLSPKQPTNITSLLRPVAETYDRRLRSSVNGTLAIPRSRTSLYDRSFSVSAPGLWNSLPVSLRHSTSLNVFKNNLIPVL